MLVLGFAGRGHRRRPDPVTEFSVIFSVVALPLTYVPILLVANDRAYMGRHANGGSPTSSAVIYLVVIVVIAVAAIPLLLADEHGTGMSRAIDLALGLLDHQLVDSTAGRCGKVDDLELDGVRDGEPRRRARSSSGPAAGAAAGGWDGSLAALGGRTVPCRGRRSPRSTRTSVARPAPSSGSGAATTRRAMGRADAGGVAEALRAARAAGRTESGDQLGRVHDVRAELTPRRAGHRARRGPRRHLERLGTRRARSDSRLRGHDVVRVAVPTDRRVCRQRRHEDPEAAEERGVRAANRCGWPRRPNRSR